MSEYKTEILTLKNMLDEAHQASIEQQEQLHDTMLEKVNEFSKRLREHIDSTYSDLNDNMKELEGDITNLDAFIVKTSSTLSELQNYADNKTILSQMMPSSSSSSSLKNEKKSDDDNNVDRKYYSTVIRKS